MWLQPAEIVAFCSTVVMDVYAPLLLQAENDELALREEPKVDFSGEEGQGRFLDLHEHYHTFINSKFGHSKEQAPKEYQEYVRTVTDFAQIPRQHRISRPYRYTCQPFTRIQHLQSRYTGVHAPGCFQRAFSCLNRIPY